MSKDYFNGKKTFITGAGSGIGRATAMALGALGTHLLLSDVHAAALAETEQLLASKGIGNVETYVLDVSNYADMQAVAAQIRAKHTALDILINNAGVGLGGSFVNTSVDDWRWIIGVNLMGVVHGCKVFVDDMVKARSGHIVNLASMAGYFAPPDMSAYAATKHAVMGLSESLRFELAPFNIGVSAICPGVINTNIISNGKMIASERKLADLKQTYIKRNYGPEKVAEAIVNAIINNKAVVPVSPEAWAVYGGKRFAPMLMDLLSKSKWAQKQRL